MITFTKEQLIASALARIDFAEMMLAGELEPLKERTWSIELELARIALASLEAEPVGEIVLGEYDDGGCHPDARVACIAADGQADWGNFKDGTRLYAAPPSPAEIDERDAFNAWNNDENLPIAGVGAKNAAWLAWQARAKLYAPPAQVSVHEAAPVAYIFKHPAGRLFWSLTDESNKGQSDVMPVYSAPVSAFVPPAIEPDYEVIKGILPTANPDEYACCIAADMWNACRAAMLQGADGNSPVIPDGWVACSERLPEPEVDVQVYCSDKKEQMVGYLERNEREGCFRFATWRNGDGIYCQPTHWMPLPTPPKK